MPKILVAEDEPELLRMYQLTLTNAGFSVVTTLDGQICIDAYLAELKRSNAQDRKTIAPFDLVLLDLRMPKKTGAEVAHEIMALCPTQKILMITAFGGQLDPKDEDLQKIVIREKPIDIDDLIETVKRLTR